jgi:hypothetical protein
MSTMLYLGGPQGLAWTPSRLFSGWLVKNAIAAGDIDRDGYADVLSGGCDRAVVRRGGPTGLTENAASTFLRQDLAYHTPPSLAYNPCSGFGDAMAAADMNGDGYTDVVIGAPDTQTYNANWQGMIYTYRGGPTGYGSPTVVLGPLSPGNLHGANFGQAVTIAGDLNRDGYPEIAVGIPTYPWTYDLGWFPGAGRTWVFTSGAKGFNTTPIADLGNPNAKTKPYEGHFGSALTAGDFDRDGSSELVVAAPTNGNGTVYSYRTTGTSIFTVATRLTSTYWHGRFGFSVGGLLP